MSQEWKLVPVVPTTEMVEAFKARVTTTSRGGLLGAGAALAKAIAAAPVPPAVQDRESKVNELVELMDHLSGGMRHFAGAIIDAGWTKLVPPAGGEVEVLGYSVKGNRYAIRLTKGELLELYEGYTGDALVELVDRAHVTRLTAENAMLRAEVADALKWKEAAEGGWREANRVIAMQRAKLDDQESELTKARELLEQEEDENMILREALKDVIDWIGCSQSTAALRSIAQKALDHQSAPAAKGGNDE